MGMSSYNCRHCGRSIRSQQGGYKDWMEHAVVITKRGEIMRGHYDGYGRVGGFDHAEHGYGGDFAMFHEDCYEYRKRTRPAEQMTFEVIGESTSAGDKGWGGHEPFTIFPTDYDPKTYISPRERQYGKTEPEFNLEVRETHEDEALEVLAALLPLLPSLELSSQSTVADLLVDLQERHDERTAQWKRELEERRAQETR